MCPYFVLMYVNVADRYKKPISQGDLLEGLDLLIEMMNRDPFTCPLTIHIPFTRLKHRAAHQ